MPLILSTYGGPPIYLFNSHLETIIPSLFRKIEGVNYFREKINTPDADFLNLDWSKVGSQKLLIISHGLEGDSKRHYVKALVKLFNANQVDVLAWNNRTCGGEMNQQPILYHHGASYDLDTVISHALKLGIYQEIVLAGISMGGAQTLKYLGDKGTELPTEIKKAAVYSTPCNLPSSAATLKSPKNRFYKNRFLGKLKKKMVAKAQQFPELIDLELLHQVEEFDTFDTHFTAKIHGFSDAQDFYESVSADRVMSHISIPTLVINAENDPLLGPECYPIHLAQNKANFFLEIPKRGGHTGFTVSGQEYTYVEQRLLEFLK